MKLVCDNCDKAFTADPWTAAIRRDVGDGVPIWHDGEMGMLRSAPPICDDCRSSPELGLILQRSTIRANIAVCLPETVRAKLNQVELKDLVRFIMECVYAYHQDICPLGYQQALEAQIKVAANDARPQPPRKPRGARKSGSKRTQ